MALHFLCKMLWRSISRHWNLHLFGKARKLQVLPILISIATFEFLNFSSMFLNPNIFFANLNSNCYNLLDIRNLKKDSIAKNCSDLFVISRKFSRSLEHIFLTVCQNNFGKKNTFKKNDNNFVLFFYFSGTPPPLRKLTVVIANCKNYVQVLKKMTINIFLHQD